MDINVLRGIITLITMILFIAICITVYSKRNKKKYEDAARMALEDDTDNSEKKGEGDRDE